MRGVGPKDEAGVSIWYRMVNGGKTVVEIDLKSDDRQARLSVPWWSSPTPFSNPTGRACWTASGFGHEALHEMNPGIVSCSLSGWGLEGPYRLRGGHDINYMGLMGGLERSGVPERPIVAFPPTADFASGMQAALGIMGGLIGRSRNGNGQGATIDVSIAETVLPWQVWALNGLFHKEWDAARGAQFPNGGAAFYNIYETGDGRFITLGRARRQVLGEFLRRLRPARVDRASVGAPTAGGADRRGLDLRATADPRRDERADGGRRLLLRAGPPPRRRARSIRRSKRGRCCAGTIRRRRPTRFSSPAGSTANPRRRARRSNTRTRPTCSAAGRSRAGHEHRQGHRGADRAPLTHRNGGRTRWSPWRRKLNGILSWVEQLGEVDTEGVEPMTGAIAADAAAT